MNSQPPKSPLSGDFENFVKDGVIGKCPLIFRIHYSSVSLSVGHFLRFALLVPYLFEPVPWSEAKNTLCLMVGEPLMGQIGEDTKHLTP